MKPMYHAQSSAKKFGGNPGDYLELHNLMDNTKSVIGDNRHRAIFHSTYGIFLVEKILGQVIVNSDQKQVPVRELAEQHCLEDFNDYIPTLQDYLQCMQYQPWMHGEVPPPSAAGLAVKLAEVSKKTFNWRKD